MEIDSPENMMRHIRFLKNEVERLKKNLRTTELQRKWPLNLSHDFVGINEAVEDICHPVLIKDVIGKTDPQISSEEEIYPTPSHGLFYIDPKEQDTIWPCVDTVYSHITSWYSLVILHLKTLR